MVFLQVTTVVLMIIALVIFFCEIVAWVETCKAKSSLGREQYTFQLKTIFFAISISNIFTLCFFMVDAYDNTAIGIGCNALTKLMAIGYCLSFEFSYIMLTIRAKIAGRMFTSPRYVACSRATETLAYVFLPVILLPVFFSTTASYANVSDERCILSFPMFILLMFLFGNIIISAIIVGLFLYPILVTARSTGGMNTSASQMFLSVAKINAKVSSFAMLSTTLNGILFCVLTYYAHQNEENIYLLLIAHGLTLIDMVFVSICFRSTMTVWAPKALARRTHNFWKSSTAGDPSNSYLSRDTIAHHHPHRHSSRTRVDHGATSTIFQTEYSTSCPSRSTNPTKVIDPLRQTSPMSVMDDDNPYLQADSASMMTTATTQERFAATNEEDGRTSTTPENDNQIVLV